MTPSLITRIPRRTSRTVSGLSRGLNLLFSDAHVGLRDLCHGGKDLFDHDWALTFETVVFALGEVFLASRRFSLLECFIA